MVNNIGSMNKNSLMVLNNGPIKKFEKIDPRYFSCFLGSAFFTFSQSATVWPQMRKCQNFENVCFALYWAVEMPQTKKPKNYIPPE